MDHAARKALELSREVGDGPELFSALGRLGTVHFNRNELNLALEVAQQMLRIAESGTSRVLHMWAHYFLGFVFSALGENQLAYKHLEESLALYDRTRGGSYGFVQDPGPTGLASLGSVLHKLGYPDRALDKVLDAVRLARELAHPFTLSWVLNIATYIRTSRGDEQEAFELCDENVALCNRYGFAALLPSAMVWQGYGMVRRGMAEGIARIHEGLALTMDSRRSDALAVLAQAFLRLGHVQEGLSAVIEAVSTESIGGRRYMIAWLDRLKGKLLLAQDDPNEAEAEHLFRHSIEIAVVQGDKSQQLASTLDLSRLIAKKNQHQARAMLAGIYSWFTEGFDTADLRDAKALLNELGDLT